MNLVDIEKVIAKIQHQLFKKSNSYTIGLLKSQFKGAGLQFKEHQTYVPGDDVRFIDWKLTAKTNKTFIKTFEEERNVEIVVVIDISNTMFSGFKKVSKLKASIELLCLLYMLTEKTNDLVTAVIFHNEMTVIPPVSGRKGISALISILNKLGLVDSLGDIKLSLTEEFDYSSDKKLSVLKSYVAKKKEVIYLGDFSSLDNFHEYHQLFKHVNMHPIKLIGPLEEENAPTFSLFGLVNREDGRRFFKIGERQKIEGSEYIKELSVASKYLEEFIRIMVWKN